MDIAWIGELLLRVAPILLFLAAITIVAELADIAGVFQVASGVAARWGRGSVRSLWIVAVLIASLTTILLSLDTTAVLLTPVMLTLAKRLGLPPWPFALATVWLANTASLLLPVSNLTNLLLVDKLQWSVLDYTARMWLPALAAILVSVVVLALLLRTWLRGSYEHTPAKEPRDTVLLRASVGVCIAVGPLVVVGVAPWIVAMIGAALLVAVFIWRRREVLTVTLLPWRLVLITLAMFLIVGLLEQHGLSSWLASLAGTGTNLADLLRMSATAGVASNLVNNLPAYIALEPVAADSPDRMLALLIGTNLGPLITVWGSLATLLWLERCRKAGMRVSAGGFAAAGVIGVPLLVLMSTSVMWMTR